MLSVTGASGSGKTTALETLRAELDDAPVACVEFDSIGVPPGADTAWRHRAVEHWVRAAIAEQEDGRRLVLCGQVAFGEILAAPSAPGLDGVAACLLHCSPAVRRTRLIGRGEDPRSLRDHLAFGEWLLAHAHDPRHRPEVIREAGDPSMRWERWAGWTAGDPRWRVEVIDTDALTAAETGRRVAGWVREALGGQGSAR